MRMMLSKPKRATCPARTSVSKAGTDGALSVRWVLGGQCLWATRRAPTYPHVRLSQPSLKALFFRGTRMGPREKLSDFNSVTKKIFYSKNSYYSFDFVNHLKG